MAVKLVQEFNETAHVRALELMGQINVHVYGGHRMLDPVALVHHGNRIADIFHPHLVDADVPVVSLILDIDHKRLSCARVRQLQMLPPGSSLFCRNRPWFRRSLFQQILTGGLLR